MLLRGTCDRPARQESCGAASTSYSTHVASSCARGTARRPRRSKKEPSAASTASPQTQQVSDSFVSPAARRALFQAVTDQPTEVEAPVSGTIPAWLNGSLLINGGGNYSGMQHMFDGYALVNKLHISGGKVASSHRYLGTKAWKAFSSSGRMRYREFATPLPAATQLEAAANIAGSLAALVTKSEDSFTDNASVNVVLVAGGKLLALSESMPSSYLVDPSDLSTSRQVVYTDGVKGDLTTAHPKLLPDGTLINFSRSLPFGGFHVYRQDPATLQRTEIAFIADRNPLAPAWVHDFAISEHYAVICETPLYFSMPSLVLGTSTDYTFMDWKPQDGTRVHVVPLDGSGPVRTFTAPAFFTFHYINAFESADGQSLHLDMGMYDDPEVMNDLYLDRLAAYPGNNISRSYLRRLTIPLARSASSQLAMPTPLVPDEASYGHFCEFPAVNRQRKGKEYRYAYTLAAVRPTNMGNALAKSDLQQGSVKLWHEAGCAPGEPAFVAAPGGASEDAGVVLDLVMGADGRSFLLVLDAASWTELARAQLPAGMPYRFHGTFVPA